MKEAQMKERFRKLMNEIGCESSADNADIMTPEEMVKECKYQLDNYYSEGSSYYDLKYDEPKLWRSQTEKLKRFITSVERKGK
jgi:hypothetical protein